MVIINNRGQKELTKEQLWAISLVIVFFISPFMLIPILIFYVIVKSYKMGKKYALSDDPNKNIGKLSKDTYKINNSKIHDHVQVTTKPGKISVRTSDNSASKELNALLDRVKPVQQSYTGLRSDKMEYIKSIEGMSPEEVFELNKAMHDEFSHDLYHESNKTVHNANGVYMVYDATAHERYIGESFDTIKEVERLFKKSKGQLHKAYAEGHALRIKFIAPDDIHFRSKDEIVNFLESTFNDVV